MDNLAYHIDIWDEMLDGKLIAMSPRPTANHNIAAENIIHAFKKYLKGKPCKVFGELDVFLSKKDRVIPDIIICNKGRVSKPPDKMGRNKKLLVQLLVASKANIAPTGNMTGYGSEACLARKP